MDSNVPAMRGPGRPPGRVGPSADTLARARRCLELREQGMPVTAIAARMQLSRQRVHKLLELLAADAE
jgi:DNA-binding CsgD family transcriptional regulator